ncbi:hypothetical protein NECAME_12912 [Necator americanus]|uniref:Uncharacterized protein n=1 Tax=Necator americanus TaxID=51031 RepID=W2SZW0_NECAM|nr:hypothetical protein NECAME_12912 [Necator americanus]ETN74551.1 hypothetical protein NECAME_12912 [Necator americanus]
MTWKASADLFLTKKILLTSDLLSPKGRKDTETGTVRRRTRSVELCNYPSTVSSVDEPPVHLLNNILTYDIIGIWRIAL